MGILTFIKTLSFIGSPGSTISLRTFLFFFFFLITLVSFSYTCWDILLPGIFKSVLLYHLLRNAGRTGEAFAQIPVFCPPKFSYLVCMCVCVSHIFIYTPTDIHIYISGIIYYI